MSKVTRAAKEVRRVIHPNTIKTIIRSGGASAGPPLGPLLGQRGIPIAKFVAEFNDLTKDLKPGIPLLTRIHLEGKKFRIQLMEPTTSFLIKQAAGIKKGKRSTDTMDAGWITFKHVYEIAKVKIEQENIKIRAVTMQEMCQFVAYQCETIGVKVLREYDPEEYDKFLIEREEMDTEYHRQKEEAMAEAKKKLAKKLLREAKM